MASKIFTTISVPLYNRIIKEKKRLQKKEVEKIKSKRKKITMIDASQSLLRRIE